MELTVRADGDPGTPRLRSFPRIGGGAIRIVHPLQRALPLMISERGGMRGRPPTEFLRGGVLLVGSRSLETLDAAAVRNAS